jgi:hypothetical protein
VYDRRDTLRWTPLLQHLYDQSDHSRPGSYESCLRWQRSETRCHARMLEPMPCLPVSRPSVSCGARMSDVRIEPIVSNPSTSVRPGPAVPDLSPFVRGGIHVGRRRRAMGTDCVGLTFRRGLMPASDANMLMIASASHSESQSGKRSMKGNSSKRNLS